MSEDQKEPPQETKHFKVPRGAPSGYNPKLHPMIVQFLAEQGRTDVQIARALDINPDTLYQWYAKYPELSEAKKGIGLSVDDEVEIGLYQRAKGYYHPEVKIFFRPGDKEPTVVEYMKYYPPDTIAAIYWTKNRQRARWRDAWAESTPIGDTSPLAVTFPEAEVKALLDPQQQDNLEIGEGPDEDSDED